MEKEFIPYELAVKLKELGFDEPCFGAYIGNELRIFQFSNDIKGYVNDANLIIAAPLFQQAFRWLTEEHDLYYSILPRTTSGHRLSTTFNIVIYAHSYNINVQAEIFRVNGEIAEYANKEDAELACIIKLIEIVENEKTL